MSGAVIWKEAKAPDGRTYYWNTTNKETRWEKPEVARTPEEQAALDQAWRPAKAPDGRTYYYNAVTKETLWEEPEAHKRLQQQQQQNGGPPAPAFVAGGAPTFNSYDGPQSDRRQDRDPGLPQKPSFDRAERPWERRDDGGGYRGPTAAPSNEPEHATFEEAEAAFMKVLRKNNVQPEWSWDQTMRATIKDPQYRSLKDPNARKAAFEKFRIETREQEKERNKERREKLKLDFSNMLKMHDEIHHYTRWKTARPLIEDEMVFKSTADDDERRQLFEEYIVELKRRHIEDEAANRRAALAELGDVLRSLDLDPDTRWSEAQGLIMQNKRFTGDKKFSSLTKTDVLEAFERHIKQLERQLIDSRAQERHAKTRRERKERDAFVVLLKDLRKDGKIRAGSKFKDVHPLLEDDKRYLAVLGHIHNSSPLDFFWDEVEEGEAALRAKRNWCLDTLEETRYEMIPETTFEQFAEVMSAVPKTASIDEHDLRICYDRLMAKILRRAEEDKAHAEKQQRRAIDALRSVIKHLSPPVHLRDTWEDVKPRVQDTEEFALVESEEGRRKAFDKHIARLKEKEEDAEKERARRAERDRSRRDRDRRHRTRTPELDAYAEERRKAVADRERQYRKASFGLTPPPRDRRDRDDRRRERDGSGSVYERERREREAERERSYVSRADPRDKGRTLDYGDEGDVGSASRPGSIRKRRESEGSRGSRRESKRPRKAKTPEAKEPEPELQSGSEEGEIEEV